MSVWENGESEYGNGILAMVPEYGNEIKRYG